MKYASITTIAIKVALRRAVLWALTLLGLGISIATGYAADSVTQIDISKFKYQPGDITVKPGTLVRWANHDETPHTVISKDKILVSPAIDTDEKFEFRFTLEGDYAYICSVHPFMAGVVHVRK